jgi:predicted transposase/invertase (TIGR01784 family)
MKMAMKNEKEQGKKLKVLPINSVAFSWLFTSKENMELLKHLLIDVAGLKDVESVDVDTPYSVESLKVQMEGTDYKYLVHDAVVTEKSGRTTIVEMQNYVHEFFPQRILAGVCNRYSQKVEPNKIMSKRYKNVRDVIGLALLSKDSIWVVEDDEEENEPLLQYELVAKQTQKTFPGAKISVIVVKLNQELKDKYPLMRAWVSFFRTGEVDDEAPKYLKEAVAMLDAKQWTTEEEKLMLKAKDSDLLVEEYIETAYNRGTRDGIEQGIEQGVETTAKNLLNLGVDKKVICDATGLTEEDLENLSK